MKSASTTVHECQARLLDFLSVENKFVKVSKSLGESPDVCVSGLAVYFDVECIFQEQNTRTCFILNGRACPPELEQHYFEQEEPWNTGYVFHGSDQDGSVTRLCLSSKVISMFARG